MVSGWAVSGWVALSERFGKLPFETLFEPAITYAENGFPVSPVIATLWQRAADELGTQPGFAETFMPGGRAPRGSPQPALARLSATRTGAPSATTAETVRAFAENGR